MYVSCLDFLTVYMETSNVLPLGPLDADPDCPHSGDLDEVMTVFYCCGGKPNLDIPEYLGVKLPTLGVEADGQVLQRDLQLSAQQVVN